MEGERRVPKNIGGVVPWIAIRAARRDLRCEIHARRNPDPSPLWSGILRPINGRRIQNGTVPEQDCGAAHKNQS